MQTLTNYILQYRIGNTTKDIPCYNLKTALEILDELQPDYATLIHGDNIIYKYKRLI